MIQPYAYRHQGVEAMQVTNPISTAELQAFCGLMPMSGMMGELTVTVPTPFGSVLVGMNGWIVKNPLGQLFGYTDDGFRALFTNANPTTVTTMTLAPQVPTMVAPVTTFVPPVVSAEVPSGPIETFLTHDPVA